MKVPITIVLLALSAIISPRTARSQDTSRANAHDAAKVNAHDTTKANAPDTARPYAQGDALQGDKVYTKVEIESSFPGGSSAWLQFLQQHLVYPDKAVRKKIEGTVMVQFIVDKDGTIYDMKAVTGDPLLQEAALKAMANTPRWIPATVDGRKVKSYKRQPIVFSLH